MEIDPAMLAALPFSLRVEIEENTCRKDFTESELANLQRIVIDLWSAPENKRQGARTDLSKGTCTEDAVQVERPKRRQNMTEKVAKLFGESERNVRKRMEVVDAAEAEPEKFGHLTEQMDKTGKVDAAFRELRIIAQRESYASQVTEGCTVDDLKALAESGSKFNVIYADPPWTFEVYSGKGKQRSAERHYDTMSLDEIKAMPVPDLASDHCALLLWGVWPELPGALEVIQAWGFEYKTAGFVWVKQNRSGEGVFTGMGYWTRANTEPCLLATRGHPLRLAADVHQVIDAPVGQHSAKPDEARARIQRLLGGPYLELFGRAPVPGWTVWGNQIERANFAEVA